jgi:transposase-like protein
MLFTIERLLSRYGVSVEDTPYKGLDEMNSRAFDAADFFRIADMEKYKMNFAISRKREAARKSAESGGVYVALSSRLETVKARLRELRGYGRRNSPFPSSEMPGNEAAVTEEIRSLRSEKAGIAAELARLTAADAEELKKERVLTYKDTTLINSLKNMREVLPELRGYDAGSLEHVPVFTRAFDELPAKLALGGRFAVVGGPCLLGTGEMVVSVVGRDGRSSDFDFNTGNHSGDIRDYNALGPYIRDNADDIVKILFENKKRSLSVQDYESLRLPMEFGRALDIPVVIPLPDASYMKSIASVASCLAPDIGGPAAGDFAAETRGVVKLFLDAIEELGRRLRPPAFMALHSGDEAAMRAFYDARKPYYDKIVSAAAHRLETISIKRDRIDAVADYILYPALPFYLWGIENIIEIDPLGETDSLRKCAKAHGSDISIFGILYPERLDRSASRAMSMAPVEDKEYLI